MRDRSFPENIAIDEIGLDQRNFFDAERPLLIRIKRPTKCLQPRYDIFPWIPWQMILGGIVGCNDQLDQDIFTAQEKVSEPLSFQS